MALQRKILALVIAACLAAIAYYAITAPAGGGKNAAGEQPKIVAPPFTLPDLGGRQVALADFGGKVTLINFWATWCPPCLAEMPELEALHRQYASRGFTVLAVNVMSRETIQGVQEFVRKGGYTFPVLLDTESKAARAYGVGPIPASFLVDGQGMVRWRKEGPVTAREMAAVIEPLLAPGK